MDRFANEFACGNDSPPDLSPEDFRQQYPLPAQANPDRLTQSMLAYLDQLESAVQAVNEILAH